MTYDMCLFGGDTTNNNGDVDEIVSQNDLMISYVSLSKLVELLWYRDMYGVCVLKFLI